VSPLEILSRKTSLTMNARRLNREAGS